MQTLTPYMNPTLTYVAAGEDETARLAAAIARLSVAGDLIRLVGDLGMGKSSFCRQYLQTLGHKGEAPSPTYTLVQTYEHTRFPVAHVDCYRMKNPAELDGLGLEDYRRFGILLVEWPERGSAMVADGQPDLLDYYINSIENPGTLTLRFSEGPTPLSRTIVLEGSPAWQRRFGMLGRQGIEIPGVVLNRPVSEDGRRAFLDGLGLKDYTLEGKDNDWSFRHYVRVRLADGGTRMLMDSPPPLESVKEYADVAEYYAGIGLRAAKIEGRDDAEGYLLTEDFGNTTLLEFMKNGTAQSEWYKVVADGLLKQCAAIPPEGARTFSPTDWWVESVRFMNWYVPYARGKAATLDEYARWQELWAPLYAKVMQLPKGLMMWDCHCSNLMVIGDTPALENVAWIDIQDARVAPVAQDLALLLRDIRTGQNDALEAEILDYVAGKLGCSRTELQTAVEICSLHHCCRVLGGLTRMHVRDGRSGPASTYMMRTWDVARQSFACPEVAAIAEMMQPFEAPGLARLWKETAGSAA